MGLGIATGRSQMRGCLGSLDWLAHLEVPAAGFVLEKPHWKANNLSFLSPMLWSFWKAYDLASLVTGATPQGRVSFGPLPGLYGILAQLGGPWKLIRNFPETPT